MQQASGVDSGKNGPVFAYHVPLNPYEPQSGEWGTLVRRGRICVGDRLNDLAVAEVSGDLRTIHGSSDQWEVIAVETAEDDGRRAIVRRKLAPDAVWDGTLVLRLVKPTTAAGSSVYEQGRSHEGNREDE